MRKSFCAIFLSALLSICVYTKRVANFYKYAFVTLASLSLLTACGGAGLNQIFVKQIQNEATGEIEEYRSVKISEDEKNEYFLDVRIPKDYKEITPQVGTFLTVYRFSTGDANQYFREGLMISKTNSPEIDSIERYAAWIDSSYRESKGDPLFRDVAYGHEGDADKLRVKTYTMKYVFPCSYKKAGAICFSGQKEVDVMKFFKQDGNVWAVEYSNLINPVGDSDYENSVKEVFKKGEQLIENCCKITTVKKQISQATPQ